jgi:hypothetical protein
MKSNPSKSQAEILLMKFPWVLATLVGVLVLVIGCRSQNLGAARAQYECKAWTNTVETAEQMAVALKYRWSLETIVAYCEKTEPDQAYMQNFVAFNRWQGDLYANQSPGLVIYWYASHEDGKLYKYILNAIKGDKHWVVELGDKEVLGKPFTFSGRLK